MSGLKELEYLKIPLKEIESATKNFETCIGKGGFGLVYKGELSIYGKPTTVAVKRLDEQWGQGLKEFLTEIVLLSGQNHPNLITLLGYCDEGRQKMIVYEYAERGSLDKYIRSNNMAYSLTWLERLRICLDVACGLDHLHNHAGKGQTIIHRDIKSANILIDHNWVAKISDLGMSKLGLVGLDRSAIISRACGTPGYCEPEYIFSGIVKKESDVYSFGMVLFEVLCGRLCVVRDQDGLLLSENLIKHYYQNMKMHEIIDPGLREQMSSESMKKFLAVAYKCLHKERGQRPSMNHVVKELQESLEIQTKMATKLSKSEKVSMIFRQFDINKDGGLNKEEMSALMVATNSDKKLSNEQINHAISEIFRMYVKFIDGKKGLTYDGLLQTYDYGNSDVDNDFKALGLDKIVNRTSSRVQRVQDERGQRIKELKAKFEVPESSTHHDDLLVKKNYRQKKVHEITNHSLGVQDKRRRMDPVIKELKQKLESRGRRG